MQGIRTIGQLLVVLVAVAAFYRAYKRWRTIRAIRRIASKVVLITGASSGLGEGNYFINGGVAGCTLITH